MWDFLSSQSAICVGPGGESVTGPKPLALLSGSFNPLHHGHTGLAAVAAARLGVPVHFELSVTNVDKPELPRGEVERRLHQFATIGTVWVTRAPTFVQKAELFPGSSFILGWDTAVRVIDPRYYGGIATRDAALEKLRDYGCRFVVAGRADATGSFRVWNCPLAGAFAELFLPLTEADFRVDISSTYLRGLESKPAS